ncbi:MAG: class I adenylate-forming enzyme family protein [Acidobacteriota bacterium]
MHDATHSSLPRPVEPETARPHVRNLLDLAWRGDAWSDSRPALSFLSEGGWRHWSRAELARRAAALADRLLDSGLPRGATVALLSEGRPEWALGLLGAWRAGAVVVPLDPALTDHELGRLLERARPEVVLVSPMQATRLRDALVSTSARSVLLEGGEPAESVETTSSAPAAAPTGSRVPRGHEPALLVFTSGTTGRPRPVVITAENLLHQVDALRRAVPLREDDCCLSVLSPSHLLEITTVLLVSLAAGNRVLYLDRLGVDELTRALDGEGVTRMVVVPSVAALLLTLARGRMASSSRWPAMLDRVVGGLPLPRPARQWLGSRRRQSFAPQLRTLVCGGAPLPVAIGEGLEALGIDVLEGYGMTETSPVLAVGRPDSRRLGTVGQPLSGVELRIEAAPGHEGEIRTRGPQVSPGVLDDDGELVSLTDHDGWLATGDLGRMTDDGQLVITGRLSDLIVLPGGRKVQPVEVERVLADDEAVDEVLVVGHRGARGEEPWAVVVPRDDDVEPQALELRLRARLSRLAFFKRPKRFLIRTTPLPRTTRGKLHRLALMQELEHLEVSPC